MIRSRDSPLEIRPRSTMTRTKISADGPNFGPIVPRSLARRRLISGATKVAPVQSGLASVFVLVLRLPPFDHAAMCSAISRIVVS
jgi:hypothetical protein